MEKLGYIVSKNKVSFTVDYIGVVKTVEEADKNLPMIIVGYSEAREYSNNEKFSTLNKVIDNEKFWTFGRTERRNEHEKDLLNFFSFCLKKYINNIKYYYINIYNINYSSIKKILNIIINSDKNYFFIDNFKMLYMLYENNNILGISLDNIEYIGINKNKIINKIKNNKNNIIYYNDNFLSIDIKKVIRNNRYIIPSLIKMSEDEKGN